MEQPSQHASETTYGSPTAHTNPVNEADAGIDPGPSEDASAGGPVADAAPAVDSAPPAPTAEMDDTFIFNAVARQRYQRSFQFSRVTSTAFTSAVTTGSTIQEWVSSKAYDDYTSIEPDKLGSNAKVPEGTIIVREVLDADNTVTKLTLMAKGPPGYNPALGDWWFGVTDPDGTPQTDDAGPVAGRLTQCFGCHIPRAKDDYLFGVLPANRTTKGH